MALILPDVPALRLRLLRLWSNIDRSLPRFSWRRLQEAARTSKAMPLGVQQLKRQRTSTLLSLAGVTASLLVIFAQLGIERSVYDSGVRIHRAVVGDLVLVPPGFKSLQLHAEVPAAMTDIVDTNPAVAGTAPFWFGIMSMSHAGMKAPRQLAWYAIDVERPAIDVPGLKENLYKLREARRMLFDRDSRPYFGALAEVAERGEEVPVVGPPDFRSLLHVMFVVGTVSIGPTPIRLLKPPSKPLRRAARKSQVHPSRQTQSIKSASDCAGSGSLIRASRLPVVASNSQTSVPELFCVQSRP